MKELFVLLVIYQIKHFVADFPLQRPYMLGKFKKSPDYFLPLLAHGAVHGLFTTLIALFFKSPAVAILFGLSDMAIHCVIDRIKASPNLLGRFQVLSKNDFAGLTSIPEETRTALLRSNTYFWWALGIDQFAHHITHYVLIWALLAN